MNLGLAKESGAKLERLASASIKFKAELWCAMLEASLPSHDHLSQLPDSREE